MLILTRRPGEAIAIGDDIVLTVNEIRGDRVRIGIEAPGDVHVLRAELSARGESTDDPNEAAATQRKRSGR